MYSRQDGDFCLTLTIKAGRRGPVSPVSIEYCTFVFRGGKAALRKAGHLRRLVPGLTVGGSVGQRPISLTTT
jgi:hypothetical protein